MSRIPVILFIRVQQAQAFDNMVGNCFISLSAAVFADGAEEIVFMTTGVVAVKTRQFLVGDVFKLFQGVNFGGSLSLAGFNFDKAVNKLLSLLIILVFFSNELFQFFGSNNIFSDISTLFAFLIFNIWYFALNSFVHFSYGKEIFLCFLAALFIPLVLQPFLNLKQIFYSRQIFQAFFIGFEIFFHRIGYLLVVKIINRNLFFHVPIKGINFLLMFFFLIFTEEIQAVVDGFLQFFTGVFFKVGNIFKS